MKTIRFAAMIISATIFSSFSMEGKTLAHVISVPIIEGLGVYSSVKSISDGGANSKAAGITNLSLLAINAGFGAYTMFGKPAEYGTFRTIHRIVGFAVTGAALWLTVAASTDDNVASHVKYLSGGYTALSVVPLIIFKF